MTTELVQQKTPTVIDGAVRFTVLIEGRATHECEISSDVLVERFGATSRSDDDLLEAFRQGRDEIVRVAGQTANNPVNGIIMLGTGDFPEPADKKRPSA